MCAGGAPPVAVDGEVIEVDPPRKLVQTWRMVMDPGMAAEGFTRLTYEIQEGRDGVSRLTVTHDSRALRAGGDGRWRAGIDGRRRWLELGISDLKSVIETGRRMAGA